MPRVVVAAVGVLACAVLGWWLFSMPEPVARAVAAPAAHTAASMPVSATRPLAASPVAAQPWRQSASDAAWCKLPQPSLAEDPGALSRLGTLPKLLQTRAEVDRLRQAWVPALKQRGDERSLALADYLEASDESIQDLMELARHTSDPAVYGWAMTRCARLHRCDLLPPRRWIQLDPGNAAPWFYEARDAAQRGDKQALSEAVYQISQASRSDSYQASMLQILGSLREATAPGLQMESELFLLMVTARSWPLPSFSPLVNFCSGVATDPSREPACLGLAEEQWQQSDSLLGPFQASKIATLLPNRDIALWAARADELIAVRVMEQKWASSFSMIPECGQLQNLRERLAAWASDGEWHTLQARLKGQDVAALAREYREAIAQARKRDNPASAPAATPTP